MKLRNFFYFLARFSGDVNAYRRGPKATAKRIMRKRVYRRTTSLLNKLLK